MGVTTIGGYTITRELGQGGMGRVFQALSPEGATVAVKTMLLAEGLSARARWETVERFQREARAARSLTHPDIVRVLDIGADQDTFFIVMEFLDGQSIRELLDASGAIQVEGAVQIIAAACEALAYAHDHGVIHRDIKPENVMVLRNGAVKLTDFGLASIVAEKSVTQTGTVMGTFSYMSPEQVAGEKLDARSDIFSLGATFYEMLTGRCPFHAETPAAVLNRILKEEPPPVPGLPAHISRTVNRCLRKRPEHRFQNARDITAGLQLPDNTAGITGTAILPGGARAATPAASITRDIAATLTAPPPVFRCSKCGEPMNRNAASCWKCGTPNSLMAMRTQQMKRQQEVEQMLRGLTPPPNKGARWKKRR
jgi:serine/threonine-protein kinase